MNIKVIELKFKQVIIEYWDKRMKYYDFPLADK